MDEVLRIESELNACAPKRIAATFGLTIDQVYYLIRQRRGELARDG